MIKFLKEPFLHFFLLGILIFILYNSLSTDRTGKKIIIDKFIINELSAKWEMQMNRQPSVDELKGLIDSYIEQEILYREALLMQLDINDEIVKRRMAQKMEFVSDKLAASLQPTPEMLMSYYETHKEDYKRPAVYSFKHIYFSADTRRFPEKDALAALNSSHPENLGDNISIAPEYTDTDALKIARDFGENFALGINDLQTGKWMGPVRSGFGYHLVHIIKKGNSGNYSYEEVSNKVINDYNFDASNEHKKEFMASLLKEYEIEIALDDPTLKKEFSENN